MLVRSRKPRALNEISRNAS